MFRVATWNVNSLRVRLEQVLAWLSSVQPDILAVQETKLRDQDFPLDRLREAGYQCLYSGEKAYNGVALLSKWPQQGVVTDLPGLQDPQRRILCARYARLHVLNVYVPNGSEVGSDKYHYKLNWLKHLSAYVADLLRSRAELIVLGDFNIAPEDQDVHDPKAWEGNVLVSAPERAYLHQVLEHGLRDLFRMFEQPPGSFSWWDYRGGSFRRNHGLRIDLVLASHTLGRTCTGCRIDSVPRRNRQPSDHAPVVADLDLIL